ncbi:MAG: transporter substrate-binding domain-containing protein [Alphaproteobacteria bacterium]|nr:transporter substrate-binding domain-containing protein [Alphaproteobacteria bacterium]
MALSDLEKRWIKEHPIIRLGADPDYPPFEFFDDNGAYKGIASDYVRIIENRTGLKILTPVNQPWPETMRQARIQTVDLLAAVAKSNERQTFLNFSEPYQNYRRVILMRDDAPPINGIQDLAKQPVGVLRESTDPAFLRNFAPSVEARLFDSYDDALLALSNKDIDAVIGNGLSAIYIARQLGVMNIRIAAPASLENYSLYFAARKDWPELISIIDKTLATITVAERNEIQRKWALASAPTPTDYSLIWKTALGLMPFFMIAVGWLYHTKKQKNRLELVRDQLRAASIRAEAANKAKSTFLANMSHEMRTPLTSIIGFLGLTLETNPSEETKKNIQISLDSAKNLLQLINDILDLARLESGATHPALSPINLQALIVSVISAMRPLSDEKRLELTFEESGFGPTTVLQDEKLLRQILVNLIGNAIKFTTEGSVDVRLSFQRSERPGFCQYQIDVKDTGIGIEEHHQKRLTHRFEQVHSLAVNNVSGAGLGLAICKELTELLDGSFFFESEFGKGSTFSVRLFSRLPANEQTASSENSVLKPQAKHIEKGEASLGGTVVFFAEDNAVIRRLVETLLTRQGITVQLFENGRSLFDFLSDQAAKTGVPGCDLILMDIHMPEMDGLEAQRQIRRLGEPFDHLPIVALTANAIKGEREIYLAEGMDGYVTKPIDPAILLETIRQFIDIKR